MERCSFCDRPAETRAERLTLCKDCRAQLIKVRADEARYEWFVCAVRRALFEGEALSVGFAASSPRGRAKYSASGLDALVPSSSAKPVMIRQHLSPAPAPPLGELSPSGD